jgi:cardiolipin synthase
MTDMKVFIYLAGSSEGSPGHLSSCRVDAWMRTVSRVKRLLAALFLLAACRGVGRKPVGEFRLDATVPDHGAAFSSALFQTTGVQLKGGNAVDVFNNGSVFDAQLEEVSRAEKSVHIETFIWSSGKVSDRLVEALITKARKGVQCRVLVDAVGSMGFEKIGEKLAYAGCAVRMFRPVPGQDDVARLHRKMLIVDGRTGFTGGFGIDDKWLGKGLSDDPPEWRDSNLRVRGPAVRDMQQAFAQNWQEAGGELLPAAAFPDEGTPGDVHAAFVSSTEHGVVTNGDRMIQLLIEAGKRRIWISNAYFVPSTPIMELLGRKAREGVDVRVLAAGDKTDTPVYLKLQRERMDDLVKAGARAYEYAPAMMHGKTMLVDDTLVSVGSYNLDALSLNKLEEGALIVDDRRIALEEERRFIDDMAHSRQRTAAIAERR